MTLDQLRQQTSGMPGSTIIHILNPWGECAPAAILTIEDLADGDPAKDTFPPSGLVLAEEAD